MFPFFGGRIIRFNFQKLDLIARYVIMVMQLSPILFGVLHAQLLNHDMGSGEEDGRNLT